MKTLGNILWVIFGGFLNSIAWILSGIILCITIVGIPAGMQCFKIAEFVFWPFGREIQYGGKAVSFILNVLWIIFFGWELAVSSFVCGIIFCITIIGIPFGLQYFKLAKLALMPFGSTIIKR